MQCLPLVLTGFVTVLLDSRSIPFRFHVDDAKSHFVRFYFFFDTLKLSQDELKHLVLLMTLWLQCPLKHGETGDYISLEEVIRIRSRDTLSMMNNIGYKVID